MVVHALKKNMEHRIQTTNFWVAVGVFRGVGEDAFFFEFECCLFK